jgi:hypothetical protein
VEVDKPEPGSCAPRIGPLSPNARLSAHQYQRAAMLWINLHGHPLNGLPETRPPLRSSYRYGDLVCHRWQPCDVTSSPSGTADASPDRYFLPLASLVWRLIPPLWWNLPVLSLSLTHPLFWYKTALKVSCTRSLLFAPTCSATQSSQRKLRQGRDRWRA